MKKRLISIVLSMALIIGIIPYNKVEANTSQDPWVEASYPLYNQGAVDSERVERNPLIEIKFKHKVNLVDKSKISLSSDGNTYAVDLSQDTWITYDGYTLKIDINSLYRGGANPLRANAAYKLTIGEGALIRLDSQEDMINKSMSLYFTTGTHFAGSDEGLKVTNYASTPTNPPDDITIIEQSSLGVDGSIYLHFNRNIKWNKWTSTPKVETDLQALPYFKLLKSPKAYKKGLDPDEKVYDREFRYDINGNGLPNSTEQIEIESVEILKDNSGNNTNILKISPKEDLIALNKYIIQLTKKDIITDDFEKILLKSINQEIWTAPISEEGPNWDMDLISAEQIIENQAGPIKSYTIHGAPNYNEYIDSGNSKPIILYVDKKVVLNPRNPNPLQGIKLWEGYGENDQSAAGRKIKWFQIEHFYHKDIKKTKISLYPEGELHSGRYYKLEIGDEVFRSRADLGLEAIEADFVIEGDQTIGRGIYKFDVTPDHNPFLTTDFAPGALDIEFDIIGYNFKEDIKQIRFVRVKDGKTIIVPSTDLKFHDVTKITGIIGENAKKEFAKINEGKECGLVTTNAGIYDIFIDFNTGTSASLTTRSERLIVKDRPKVIRTTPTNGERYLDPERLKRSFSNPEEEGYYIEAVFENIGGSLGLVNSLPTGISVNVEGETGNNLVDASRALRSTSTSDEFILYIPLIDRPADGQIYKVSIPEATVVEYKDKREEVGKNRCYDFSFDTNYFPKADKLYEGSVPEFYDYNYPIVIDGSSFNRNTRVMFRAMDGRTYRADGLVVRDDNKTLYVYLPRNPRLPIGLYDIIIGNGYNYEIEIKHGVLSVVEQGDYIPKEEYRVKDESDLGIVKAIKKTSKDILDLHTRNRDKEKLEIDLDELMGSQVWVRSIEYPTIRGDSVGELTLKSKWANVTIKDLKLHKDADENQIELRVGRVESSLSDIIKSQIVNNNVKSNFIEISGGNFDFDKITIEIPYFESDGSGLKIVRYDEESRRFEEVLSINDLVNNTIIATSNKAGIFVVVEVIE